MARRPCGVCHDRPCQWDENDWCPYEMSEVEFERFCRQQKSPQRWFGDEDHKKIIYFMQCGACIERPCELDRENGACPYPQRR